MSETPRAVFEALLNSEIVNRRYAVGKDHQLAAPEVEDKLEAEWLARFDAADSGELADLRQWRDDQLAEREAMQGDVRELLLAVGLDPGPRPKSPHLVVVEDVLPRVRTLTTACAVHSDAVANLGLATTLELIDELSARASVSDAIGETWPRYRTVDGRAGAVESTMERGTCPRRPGGELDEP